MSAAIDAETQTRERNSELTVRLTNEDTRCSRMTDAHAKIVASMTGLGAGIEDVVVRIGYIMDEQRLDLTTLIRTGHCAACEELINLSVADFTALTIEAFADFDKGFVSSVTVAITRGEILMDIDGVPSESVLLPAGVDETSAVEKAVADFTGDVRFSLPLASQTVNFSSPAGRADVKPLASIESLTTTGIPDNDGAVSLIAVSTLPSRAKSACGTSTTPLKNQPSVVATSN